MNYFFKNQDVISKRFPGVSKQLLQNKRALDIEVFSAKNNQPAFFLKTQDGKKIIFHSQFDPEKEAVDFVASQNINKATVLFVYGLGFGYHLKELRKRFTGMIFVIEPSLDILASAMEHVDLSEVIDQEKIFLLTDILLTQQVILLYSGLLKMGLDQFVFVMHPAYGFFKEYFSSLKAGLDVGLGKKMHQDSQVVINGIINVCVNRFKESSYKDLNEFNRVRFIAQFFSIFETSVRMLFENAFFLYDQKEYPLSLEAFNVAWAEDSIRLNNKFFEEKALIIKTADCYNNIAQFYSQKISSITVSQKKITSKINIAHITSNFVDDTHSPTRLLRTFVEHHDKERFNVHVYSSELGALRVNRQYYIGIITDSSVVRGARFISFLKSKNIPVYLAPVSGTHVDTAAELFKRSIEDRIDIIFYHASMFSTADFLVSFWKPAPVQININIGAFMYSKKLDAVTYFVPSTYEQEKGLWEDLKITARLMPQGADFSDRITSAAQISKTFYDFSQDTVVFVTVGNHLDTRMSERFLEIMSCQLAKDKCAWLVIGDGDFTFQHSYLSSRGLLKRVRFLGAQRDVFSFYMMADIYVNEFPQGGGMSVLEAMSAGMPVVALYAGEHHLENCGANYVGKEFALGDESAYADFLAQLTRDKEKRKEIGLIMKERYQKQCSPKIMVKAFEDLAIDLYKQKITVSL